MAQLTYKKRESLPDSAFALPEERRYPIHDLAHARNALARVALFGSREEKVAVRREVYCRYPGLATRCAAKPVCRRRMRAALARLSR